LHSFADYDSVLIGYGTGSRFPVSDILKEHDVFIFNCISLNLEHSAFICKSQEKTVVYENYIFLRNFKGILPYDSETCPARIESQDYEQIKENLRKEILFI
jgi:hypothetical protein